MLTEAKKFVPLVEVGPPRCEDDVVGLSQAQPTHPGCWVESGGPGNYVPTYVVLYVGVSELADMA